MKVNFILPGLHLSGGIISTIELANHLAKRGNEVTVFFTLPCSFLPVLGGTI